MNYQQFLERKSQLGSLSGFEPNWMPEFLFPFQRHLVEWAIRKGRAAILVYRVSRVTIGSTENVDRTFIKEI